MLQCTKNTVNKIIVFKDPIDFNIDDPEVLITFEGVRRYKEFDLWYKDNQIGINHLMAEGLVVLDWDDYKEIKNEHGGDIDIPFEALVHICNRCPSAPVCHKITGGTKESIECCDHINDFISMRGRPYQRWKNFENYHNNKVHRGKEVCFACNGNKFVPNNDLPEEARLGTSVPCPMCTIEDL